MAPRDPATRQRSPISSGMSKGAWVQPRAAFAACASAAPKGAPWEEAVPAFVGAEKPMMVRQAISVGFLERTAMDRAAVHTVGPRNIIGEHGQYAVYVPRVKAIVDAFKPRSGREPRNVARHADF